MSEPPRPPEVITFRWCPECGRGEEGEILPDKHWAGESSLKECPSCPVGLTFINANMGANY